MSETPTPHADHRDLREVPDLADMVFDEAFWDGRYRSAPTIWSGRPNPTLVAEAADLSPGTALDVGCGEGADVAWLAERGWTATGVDVSQVALDRAAAHARGAGLAARTTWLHLDATVEPPPGRYDLVSAHFVHLRPGMRDDLHRRLAAATAPGGTLLVVAHHPDDLAAGVPRPPIPELFFTADDVAGVLDPAEWTVITSEARTRPWTDGDGRDWTISDTVLRARRRA
ncbi:cyclopropane-fatty-acyl-phospholipid synthase family protein [Pseudonocardia sp. N23]|uniref:SAM-dependent methyltransferase n=1 Tax=Pseudonocardia sp. N23 TaxID=1987376 RepID=UPI000BFC8362|nr:class I SAM-dependent methyltransferase [Pseudonocardia sp. N23]GAY09916.1 thioredoxin reductase [Pseudonocardia sp. N23]